MKNSIGKFITFDGIDGSGKTTQIELLAKKIRDNGKVVHITREPGGTVVSEKIRALLLDPNEKITSITELLLMFAARAQHIEEVLLPKINNGEWVICSRFTDATIAYQGYARGVDISKIQAIAKIVHSNFNPDISFFLDIDVKTAEARRNERGEIVDRFEQEHISFMQKVRDGFKEIAANNPNRCKLINANNTKEEVFQEIITNISIINFNF